MKKRLLPWILALVMITSLILPAMAAEDSETKGVLTEDLLGIETVLSPNSVAVVNPIYEDVQTVEDLTQPTPPKRKLLKAAAPSDSSVYTAASVEEAGEYLRKNLVERNTSVTFSIPTEDSADLTQISRNCYAEALKHTGVPVEGDYLRYHLGGYRSSWSSLDGITTYTFTFTLYTNAAQEEEMTEKVNNVVKRFGFTSDTSEYEKIRTIYDYICENIVYDNDSTSKLKYTAYAALINRTAVCQGYASLFYRLALTCGLSSRMVAGIGYHDDACTEGENHGWNIVAIDGVYYNLDTTWDAAQRQASTTYYYLLKGSSKSDFVRHEAGITLEGDPVYMPEELALLSSVNYAVPVEILIQPENSSVQMGESPSFGLAALGEGLTYHWYITWGNGQKSQATYTKPTRVNLPEMSEANKSWLHGTTAYCVVTDASGQSKTSETASVIYYDPSLASVKGYSLRLSGDIAINFFTDLSGKVTEDPNAYMHFTIPGETTKEVDIPVSEIEPREGTGYYVFPAETAAKDMTQNVHGEVFLSDGTKALDFDYCVENYGLKILGDTTGKYSDESKAMVRAMLNYGGYAQEYFDYHTDEMANRGIGDTSLPDLELDDSVKYSKTGSVSGVTYKGSSLILRSNTVIRHYFQITGEPEDVTFILNGQKLNPESSTKGTNYYSVDITGIPAKNLGTFYPLVVSKDGETMTLNYCVYSNIKATLDRSASTPKVSLNLMKSLYLYGMRSKEYFDTK